MAKALKIILSVFAAIVILLVMAALVLPFIVSPNDFKPQITAAVKAKTGRELTIDGNIELSVFPWLGVSAKNMALSNAVGFQDATFAEVANADIKAKLLPLFTKRFEVDRIVLDGLVLNLEINENGISNWADFGQQAVQTEAPSASRQPETDGKPEAEALKTAASLAIAGISLRNAHLNWHDKRSDLQFAVKSIDLESGDLAFNEPIDLKLDFELDLSHQELTGLYSLSTELLLNENFDRIQLNRFVLASDMKGASLPGGALTARMNSEADLNLNTQTLDLKNLNVHSGPLTMTATLSGTDIVDNPVLTGPVSIAPFNPTELLKHFEITPPTMRDPDALKTLNADFQLQASANSADLKDIVINLDGSAIKGNARIDDFNKPSIVFNLSVDALNADRYMAPKDESDKSTQPIAGPAAAVAAGASLIPVETLRNLNLNGLLSIDRLTVSNLSLNGFALKLTARDGKINTEQNVKGLYQGSYNGAMNLDVTGASPRWKLNEKFNGIQIEPFLTDFTGSSKIAGTLSATTNLQAAGNSGEALKSSLNGRVDFLFKDSIVRGFNLQQMIDDAKSLLKGSRIIRDNPKDQTAFSEIKGSANINNGLISNNDLIATASKINATGAGTADLKSKRINYEVNAKIVRSKSDDKVKEVPVVIDIAGTFEQPEYRLDIVEMLKDQQMEKLERKKDKLLEKLDKKIGPGASDLLKKFF